MKQLAFIHMLCMLHALYILFSLPSMPFHYQRFSQDLLVLISKPVKVSESHSVISDSLRPHGLCSPWNSPGQNTGVGNLSLLQGIFPTQESNWGLLHCRQILYQLSYQGSLKKGQDERHTQWWVAPG